jgi:alkyl hydroperoxide reductase subunit AhpC
LAWINSSRKNGGLGGLNYPLLSDFNKNISRDYNVLVEKDGLALRGLFIIDPNGIVRQITVNDLPVGRSVDETLRLLKAFQFVEKHGEVCPVWLKKYYIFIGARACGLKNKSRNESRLDCLDARTEFFSLHTLDNGIQI